MRTRAYHLVLFADYVIGAFFAFLVFAMGATAFAVTGGALKSYETQAIGNVYAEFLLRIEDGARALRSDYCHRGRVEAATACGDADALLGGPN